MTTEFWIVSTAIILLLGLGALAAVRNWWRRLSARRGRFTRREIERGLRRLGQLAKQHDADVKLQVFGGGAMMLAFNARPSTKDVDVVIKGDRDWVLQLARQVAEEFGWASGWLNDDVAQTLFGSSDGKKVFEAPGITVETPSMIHLLASKLTAFRFGKDQQDAQVLLREVVKSQQDLTQESLWRLVHGHVGNEDAGWAKQNLIIIWKELYGDAGDKTS